MDIDKYAIQKTDVMLGDRIGGGQFGDVYRGLFQGILQVAIKRCKPGPGLNLKKKLIEEATITKQCEHDNVINLIGVCNDNDPYICKFCLAILHQHKYFV